MDKPTKVKIEHWDYDLCAAYVEHKLGYKLRDALGKYTRYPYFDANVEYLDFWHFLCNVCTPANGSYIWINSDMKDNATEWESKIIDTFVEEFGDNQDYWVEWQ